MPKTALITGASSGIGAATAALFQSHGFTVFGTSREARATSPDGVAMIRLDVTSDESVQAAVGEVPARTGRL
jgi:NAD(P)-dependent dehydrogenase (short-subunit alcohol dehydrogenase family)